MPHEAYISKPKHLFFCRRVVNNLFQWKLILDIVLQTDQKLTEAEKHRQQLQGELELARARQRELEEAHSRGMVSLTQESLANNLICIDQA